MKDKDCTCTPKFGRLGAATKRAFYSTLILIALFILFSVLQPEKFLAAKNLQNLLQQIVTYTIIGCGLSFCLVCGGNDLSAGASMALSGIIVVKLLIAGMPLWVCIVFCLLMGIMTGIMNGFFIEILGVVPFVATLATQWVYRGMANVLVNGAPVYTISIPSPDVQEQFYILGGGRIGGSGLPYSVIITLVYAVILGIVLAKSRIGRQIYACGSNLEAAKLSGINAVKTRMFAYCISGLSAAICGILVASRLSSAQPTAGNGYEMEAIAASVLGGISILGGEGTILNTVIGALMMGVIRNGLNLNGVNSFWQQVIVGFILLIAVASQTANKGGNLDNIKRFFKNKKGGIRGMKKKTKFAALFLAGILLMGGLTGCSILGTTGTGETDDPENQTGETDDTKEKTIYVIVKVLGNQYWSVLQAGAEQAGKDLGCKVVVVGTALESDIEGQLTLLQNAVSAQADGIVIAPLDSVSLDAPITEAYNSGIPVVLVDTVIKSDNYSAALLTNNVEAGKTAAKELLRRMKESGLSETEESQIAIQVGSTGSQTINDRVKGFNEYWDANAPKAWTVLNDDIKVNEGDISKAVGFCQDFLTTYPKLKAVFGPNNGSTVGFVTGLTEAQRNDIIMVGFDFSAEIETMIRSDGFNVASVVQRQYFMGYDGVKTAFELANGEKVSEKTIDTGVVLVDIDNVDSKEVQSIINP